MVTNCSVKVLMDSDKYSPQVERLGVIETGRRRRWTDDEKLKIVLDTPASTRPRWRGCSPFWSADDPGRGRCADLDCHPPHRYEERHERPGVAGAGGLGRDPFAGDVFVFRG